MRWHDQRCHQCGQLIGTDCVFVTTKQGIVHPDCWDLPQMCEAAPSCAEILATPEEQPLGRNPAMDISPQWTDRERLDMLSVVVLQLWALLDHPIPENTQQLRVYVDLATALVTQPACYLETHRQQILALLRALWT
jgi:hypothetical protein